MKKENFSTRRVFLVLSLFLLGHAPLLGQEEEEDEGSSWNLAGGVRYLNKFTNYGVDLSQGNSALPWSVDIAHKSGVNASGEVVTILGSAGGVQQSSIALGYEKALSEILTLSGEFTHYFYGSDTVNALAGMTNSISFDVDADFETVSVGVSYNRYLGGDGATFFSFNITSFTSLGKLIVVPFLQIGFVSQEVNGVFLKSNKGKAKSQLGSLTQTVTGISNTSLLLILSYPLTDAWSMSFTPSFLYSPSELSAQTLQFIWSAGIRYSVDL